jgi:hypothetical protein
MSILTEDGIYNDTYIDCTIVKDNIISLLIHDKKNSVTRSYKFESVEKAEELANQLLQTVFELTEKSVDYKKIFLKCYEVIMSKHNFTDDEIYFLSLIHFDQYETNDSDIADSVLVFNFITPESIVRDQTPVFSRKMNKFFKKIHDDIVSVYLEYDVYADYASLYRLRTS